MRALHDIGFVVGLILISVWLTHVILRAVSRSALARWVGDGLAEGFTWRRRSERP